MAPIRSSSFVNINGRPIFIDVDGEGPPMIMMHGLGGSSNFFQPLVATFSKTFTVVRFDWEGLGRSKIDLSDNADRITMPKYVRDITAVMEHFKFESAILVGHSLGSVLAMMFAAQFPKRVIALVAIGPGRSRAKVPAAKAFTLQMAKNARELGMPALADGTVAKNVAASSSDVVRAFVREVIAGQDGEGYARVCEAACDDTHVDPEYGLISCPTVVVSGDQDLISPPEVGEEIAQLIGSGTATVVFRVVHSGHQQVLEDTQGVVAAIKSVIRVEDQI
ncbi:Alpha/Beta hydrolase protein [Cadophora sp. MPI-SDFR-AT-0126]|nr:Alpha/Beta hydrolase protein [Leotiomycetes sp. MPI-SDFR-AT-0126]